MKPLIFISFLAILFAGACKRDCCKHEKDNETTVLQGEIDVKTAKRLVDNFAPRSFRNGNFGYKDTRCVWFSKEQLKKLICKLEKENGDGVRFYLGTYDRDTMPGPDYDTSYKNQTTLIMVSTKLKSGKHFDYFGKTENGTDLGAILTSDPQNRGEMCPPPQTCIAEGALLFEP